MSNLKTYIVHVTNEQEIKMKIRAHDIEEAKEMIEDDNWMDYLQDNDIDASDLLVTIEASKGFKAKNNDWKIKSIKKSSLKEEI